MSKMKKNKIMIRNIGLFMAIISAFLSAFNVIIEKKYIEYISSESILFLMYLGAGVGLYIIHLITKNSKKITQNKITKKEVPKILIIVICELFASFLIIEAVKRVDASLVSILLIFEIIMTAICAYFIFKDPIDKNETTAIILMIIGCFILNYKSGVFSNVGISSFLVICACFCWGVENNITASISSKEPALFTSIKCGSVSILYLIITFIKGSLNISFPILVLFGFFTYGLAILSYAISTKYLGANKSTLVFSFSPVFGAILALIIYKESLTNTFFISAVIMICAILIINLKPKDS